MGTNTPFGYAVGLSDICVTVGNRQFECLQKVYPISRFLAAGFAGSVEIGFELVAELQRWLGPIPEDEACVPEDVGNKFPRLAQNVFDRFPDEVKRCGAHLMLFCVDPLPDDANEPRSEIYIFRHPDFTAERILKVEVVAIGSGAMDYEDVLRDFNSNPFNYLQLATVGPGGVARYLGSTAKKRVQEKPVRGVSPHLHACVVSPRGIVVQPNDETWSSAGKVVEDFKMPWVAKCLTDLEHFLTAHGHSSAHAVC